MADQRAPLSGDRLPCRERVVLAMPLDMAAVYAAADGARYEVVAIRSAAAPPDAGIPVWTDADLSSRTGWDFVVAPDLPQELWRLAAAGVESDRILRVPVDDLVTPAHVSIVDRCRSVSRMVAGWLIGAGTPRRPSTPLRPTVLGPRIVVFGTGLAGRRAVGTLRGWAEPVAFCDNDTRKHGSRLDGLPVVGVADLAGLSWDGILVASKYWPEICRQLLTLGIPAERIDLARPDLVLGTRPGPLDAGEVDAVRRPRAGTSDAARTSMAGDRERQ